MKEKVVEYLVAWILISIGIIFLIIGYFLFSTTLVKPEDKVEVEATIERISYEDRDNPSVYVSYEVDGEELVNKLSYYISSMKKGQPIKIYYHKDNPDHIGTQITDMIILIFPGIGVVLAGIGSTFVIVKMRKKKMQKDLIKKGDRIEGTYVETVYNTSFSVNGKSPYYIKCQWKDELTGTKYLFKSNNIWFNPITAIQEKNITTFPIYIDLNNKKRYTIVLDSLNQNMVDLT